MNEEQLLSLLIGLVFGYMLGPVLYYGGAILWDEYKRRKWLKEYEKRGLY